MLVRIVKLTFEEHHINDFLKIFEPHRTQIKSFDGFLFLELYQNKENPQIFFTHSHWEDESALNNYRNSDYFRTIWTKTKKLFAAKPEAWSLEKVNS
ncbi:antibiotic biosynthesis monooxygenase [Aurantibacter sp.]|uniref:putative quinol monooxygenase n=1 Tax=Aurantibacter sp. TaxID=2807103 RepID=UPI0032666406